MADAGVPGGTTIHGGVIELRERAERAEAERDREKARADDLGQLLDRESIAHADAHAAELAALARAEAAEQARDRFKGVLERMERIDHAMGIYPQSITHRDGQRKDRDAYGDGWNAAVMTYAHAMMQEADSLVDAGVIASGDGSENEMVAWRGNAEAAHAELGALREQVKAARAALADAQRVAFMAGHLAAQAQTDQFGETHETPEDAYATWQSSTAPAQETP